MQISKTTIGILSGLAVIFIWSGFIVFSRAGVITKLTTYDITALRLIVAGAAVLPFCVKWWPGHLSLHAKIIMAICGPGIVYSMLMYIGLTKASAAYGGVFANGSMPIFTAALALILNKEIPSRNQMFAIAVIITGGIVLGIPGMAYGGDEIIQGILLFLAASAFLSTYIYGIKRWKLKPTEVLALVNIPNALVFLPVWYFFLPSGLDQVDLPTILFQALFQGLGPGFLAVFLIAVTTIHLGPTSMAIFSSSVPACAVLLAMPVLSEYPTPVEWAGIIIVSFGLIILFFRPRRKLSSQNRVSQ